MERKLPSSDIALTASVGNQYTYIGDENFECENYVEDLHAQHEGGRGVTLRGMDESPEANVVRYSFWNIM